MLIGRLVIGSCIESLVYAFLNDGYYLPTLKFGPIFTDSVDNRFLGHARVDYSWSRIQLSMALTGKLLNYKGLQNIKIEENLLKVTSGDTVYKYNFESCVIFDPTGVNIDADMAEAIPQVYQVYDDFEISNLGGKHKYLRPKIGPEFEIYYYNSERVHGANYVTDCVVKSKLNKQQLNSVEYSDSLIRFVVLRDLEEIGIKGNLMGLYKNGSSKYRRPKVKHKKRVILERDKNKYADSKYLKFKSMTLQEVFDEFGT